MESQVPWAPLRGQELMPGAGSHHPLPPRSGRLASMLTSQWWEGTVQVTGGHLGRSVVIPGSEMESKGLPGATVVPGSAGGPCGSGPAACHTAHPPPSLPVQAEPLLGPGPLLLWACSAWPALPGCAGYLLTALRGRLLTSVHTLK